MNRLKIFTDFDGTITYEDVWWSVGKWFIKDKNKWAEVIKKFETLEIGARECFTNEIGLIEGFDKKIFDEIIDNQIIDKTFGKFIKFCDEKEYQLTILSEGLDYYIDRILKKNSINLPYYSNRCLFKAKDKIGIDFPNSDAECTRCGCCKRNFILNMTSDDELCVYIGDGFSDVCPVKYADIVFAKKSLASYCWKNNITYFEYQNFSDIQKKLEKIIQKKIKPRQQARLNRREVYLSG